jgi:hypothetical protein
MVDVNYNTADYGWVVYYHGFPLTTYTLKLKDDLTLEKQFARCVRGGIGDDDDIDE